VRNEQRSSLLDQQAGVAQRVRADAYLGRRVRLTARIRADTVGGKGAGAFLSIERASGAPALADDFSDRPILGTSDWRDHDIVMDVPSDALSLTFGAVLRGVGTIRADDFRLDVVDAAVQVTGIRGTRPPGTALLDPAHSPTAPINPGFEGAEELPASASAWLLANASPFVTDDPTAPLDDLEPLRALVGDARIVGLGEGSHGTREFFRMKHRVFEFLVERMGFTVFAIEATFPEALDVDRYVRTGQGDPSTLIRGMYFWTWNTDEVLDLVRWMRNYNVARGAPVLRFVGVDIQFPGASIDSVTAMVTRLDAARGDSVRAAYACLEPYRNHGSTRASRNYFAQNAGDCKALVHTVVPLLGAARTEWRGRIDDDTFDLLRQYARVVEQFEEAPRAAGSPIRDVAMAENAAWWLDHVPQARMMLWMHNLHLIRAPRRTLLDGTPVTTGVELQARFGTGYRPIAQFFGAGSVNASPAGRPFAITVGPIKTGTFEAVFTATGAPRLLLDTRKIARGGSDAARLLGPLLMRGVDELYSRVVDEAEYYATVLPGDYDGLIWFATSTQSALRP
jgi:erythromycin esterase